MKTASLIKSLVLAWQIAVCAAAAQAGEYPIASAAKQSLEKVISLAYSSPYFPHYGVGGETAEYYTLEDTEMIKVNESVAAIFWAIETYASAMALCSPGGPESITGSGLKSRLLALGREGVGPSQLVGI